MIDKLLEVVSFLPLMTVLFSFLSPYVAQAQSSWTATNTVPRPVAVSVLQKCSQDSVEVREATLSILRLVADMQNVNSNEMPVVKVPAYNYLRVLERLQRNDAHLLFPGESLPATARVTFQLETEQGSRQIVYFQ